MTDAGKVGPAWSAGGASEGAAASTHAAQLAEAALDLLGCRSEAAIYRHIGDFLSILVPGSVVIVNEADPGLDTFTTRSIAGLDDSLVGKAANLVGFDIIGKRSVISPDLRAAMLGGSLRKIPGGFPELAVSEIPLAVGEAGARLFGFRDAYTIGISDADNTLGNIHIVTRKPDTVVPSHVIESFARHCYSALDALRKDDRLAESAKRSRRLFENLTEGLALHEIILDEAGNPCDYRFLEVNPAFEAMTGLKAADVVGRTVLDVLPGTEPSWIQRYGAVATTGVATRFDQYARELGRHFEVVAYSPQKGKFATLVSDITERKELEEQLRQRVSGLTEPVASASGVTFYGLFDVEEIQSVQDAFAAATGVASIITEPDGTPITLPSNFTRLCRDVIRTTDRGARRCLESDAAFGLADSGGPVIQPCGSCGLWDAGARITAGGEHVANWLIGQVRTDEVDEAAMLAYADEIGADRDEFMAALAEVPVMPLAQFQLIARALFLFANELSVVAYQNVQQARFITERELAEAELQRLNESLEDRVEERTRELNETVEALTAANEAKTRFLRSMSHELRTPLNSVIGFSSMLADGVSGKVSDEQRRQLNMINNSGKHLLALINDILDLSRIEAGIVEVRFAPLYVPELIEELVASVGPAAQAKGLALGTVVPDPAPALISDRTKVRQVVLNLLSNAIKFTESGRVVLAVSQPSPRLVAFAVSDTGPGVPEDERERIFGEFERGARLTSQIEGTGLGLAISRGLAGSLGGTVELESAVGGGSTFTLTLPQAPEEPGT